MRTDRRGRRAQRLAASRMPGAAWRGRWRLGSRRGLLQAAGVHVLLEPLGRLGGHRAQRRDGVVARDRHRLAVLEHGRRRADLANGVDQPAQHLERGLAAAEDERGRVDRPHGAGDALGREVEGQQQRPEARAADGQLEAPARAATRGRGARRSRTAGRPASARRAGTTRRAACSQPVAQRQASSHSASRASRPSASSIAGRSTSSTVRSTERTARLSSITRSARVLVEVVEGSPAAGSASWGPRRAGARPRSPRRCCASPAARGAAPRAPPGRTGGGRRRCGAACG